MKDFSQLITALTGLVGATGGLIISYLTLKHAYRKDKHSVKLEISEAIMMFPQAGTTKLKPSENMLTFKAVNTGLKDFTVISVGLELGRRSGGIFINQPNGTVQLPYTLKPDETCNFWTEYEKLKKDIKRPKLHSKLKIRGYIRDYIGNSFYSNKLTVRFKETKRYKLRAWLRKGWGSLLRLFWP